MTFPENSESKAILTELRGLQIQKPSSDLHKQPTMAAAIPFLIESGYLVLDCLDCS